MLTTMLLMGSPAPNKYWPLLALAWFFVFLVIKRVARPIDDNVKIAVRGVQSDFPLPVKWAIWLITGILAAVFLWFRYYKS